ncbi:hypothetical protein Tco_0681688 [Tanacetum coccineum]|uniref:Uncharacterized protein n=1 Tax=Tanacetum coccineum TaxID=301880 RepID=A0ABQ4XPA4_9ASTR
MLHHRFPPIISPGIAPSKILLTLKTTQPPLTSLPPAPTQPSKHSSPLAISLDPTELLFSTPPTSHQTLFDTLEDLPPTTINPSPPRPSFNFIERLANEPLPIPAIEPPLPPITNMEPSLPPLPPQLPTFLQNPPSNFPPLPPLGPNNPFPLLTHEIYKVEVRSYRDDDEEAFLRFWVKDNISQTGTNTTVKGQHGGISSEDLYKLYLETSDFKNNLALYKNDNMRFNILVTSVENVIHTVARYQEEIQVNLDLPSTSLTNEIMPYSERSKFFYGPVSVELVLKFIQVPEVEIIHSESDHDEFKAVNGREAAKPHLNNPNCSKIGRLIRGTPGELVYPSVMTGYDLNRYSSVQPIWTSSLLKLTPPTEKEKKIWRKFEQKTPEAEVTTGTLVDEEKRSIALDYPIVSDIGNFAVFSYNKACSMHVKMVEHNLHDIEFMECKYKKVGRIYHFYLTIEAIEEGNLGIYEAEVHCESAGYSRSLYKFNLTNRKPFGMWFFLDLLRTDQTLLHASF